MPTQKFLSKLFGGGKNTIKLAHSNLINAESALGRTIFGPIPAGHQREFFMLKNNSWLWYEGYFDNSGVFHDSTIRYEIRPNGVFKSISGGNYQIVEGRELNNFREAAKSYLKLVKTKLYH